MLLVRDIFEAATAVIVSLGGGAAIVAALSGYLGKVWAERLMQKERVHYEKEIEDFKAEAVRQLESEKAKLQIEVEHFKATLSRDSDRTAQTFREKLSLYKDAIGPVVEFVQLYQYNPTNLTPDIMSEFEQKRLATSAMLGMFASQSVLEAYNELTDYILDCLDGVRGFVFSDFRTIAYKMLNGIRRDVGIIGDDVTYTGKR